MQTTRLWGVQSASRLLPTASVGCLAHRLSDSSLLLTVHGRCSAGSTLSHLSLDKRRSLITPSMSEPCSISNRRPRGRKVVPTAMEVMEARLSLLTTLIAETEGKTNLNSKQRVRRDNHQPSLGEIE